jgi:hypothetical protein
MTQETNSPAPHFEGYPTEIDYTFGYYRVLSPTFLRLVTLNRCVPFPTRRPLRYLELGYGNGVSLNIHAAASPGEYWGTDVNLSHAAFANKLAEISGSRAHALSLPFADLQDHNELPDFDVIVAHGVWSWISDSNRRAIVQLLRDKLVDGGIFFISYNALPGSAAFKPLQELIRLHSERCNRSAPPLDRLESSLSLLSKLQDIGSKFFASIPIAKERLNELKTSNRSYLYHEYLGENWSPSSFAGVATAMSDAGLRFVASADLVDHYDDLIFNSTELALIASIDDPWVRETVRDFIRNQLFRREVYVKGDVAVNHLELNEILRDHAFVLAMQKEQLPTTIDAPAARIALSSLPFSGLIDALAQDRYRVKTVRELARYLPNEVGEAEIIRALLILAASGIVHPVQAPDLTVRAAGSCEKLNEEILRQAHFGKNVAALASPITGGGVHVSYTHQLFLLALLFGAKTPDQWAKFAWDILKGEDEFEGSIRAAAELRGTNLPREALMFLQSLPILVRMGAVREGAVSELR